MKSKRKRTNSDEKEKDDEEVSIKRSRSSTPKSDSLNDSMSSTSSPSPEFPAHQDRCPPPHYPPMVPNSDFDTYVPYRYPMYPGAHYYNRQPHLDYYHPVNWYASSPVYQTSILSASCYNFPDKTNVEKPKKLTDFSIRAITGRT